MAVNFIPYDPTLYLLLLGTSIVFLILIYILSKTNKETE